MKPKEYAVIVQWGGGHIYFRRTEETEEQAVAVAKHEQRMLDDFHKRIKRGAKPHVSVWRRVYEHQAAGPSPANK